MTSAFHTSRMRLAAASGLLVCLAGLALAQTPDTTGPDAVEAGEEERPMDEIIVTPPRSGDPRKVETPYEEVMRQRILEEYDRAVREEEELAWRQEPTISKPSRINFGYRPQDQRRDESIGTMNRLPMDKVKPATVFRFEF